MNKRMAAIIKMLSSKHDGEIANAARHLGLELAKHGKDWNDLGAYLEKWSGIADPEPPKREPPKQPPPEKPRAQTYSGGERQPGWKRRADRINKDVDTDLVQDQVADLARHTERMRSNSREFIEEMTMRFEQWGNRTRVSPAQADYVNDLWEQFASGRRR
jgi:hypothetical protein